jgi:cobalamin synthase
MSTIKEEALQALAAKGEVEQNLASLADCPPSRHAAFAAIVAALVVTPTLPLPMRFVALALIFAGIFLVVQWDKRRLGVFINGYRRGKTRMIAFPLVAIILGLYFASYYFSMSQKEPGISIALAAVAFLIAYLGSLLWQRVFVSELSAR